jgi:hypothetical protein
MQVEVRLFAVFRQGRFNRTAMDLPEGTPLRDLILQLEIPEKEVSLPLVNGQYSRWIACSRRGTSWPFSRPWEADEGEEEQGSSS